MDNLSDIEILLVEDNPNDAEMALRALKQNNLSNEVLIVGDGEEALDYLYSRGKYADKCPDHHPKIILLDLKLPKVDGKEVLRILKNDPEKKIIPV
ncbi:MAG: response regulator, partial [Melioribacteraceae bacterium]|nr:response regulator [Melioribacteraceae bacterium]